MFCVDVEEILNTGINYSSFINARKIRKYFNKKYPDVIAIDPVEKFYMTKNEIKELTEILENHDKKMKVIVDLKGPFA